MRKRTYWLFCIMLLCAVFFSTFADIARAEDGVTDNEILIGSSLDLSGPLAFMGTNWREGAKLYFAYINDHGGIHGRKIKFIAEDDAFQPPRTVMNVKKLITKDKVFCLFIVMGGAGVFATLPVIEQYQIPLFPTGTGNTALAIPPRKYVFVAETGFDVQARLAVRFVLEDLKAKNFKIGVIYQEDATGQQWLKGAKEACQKYGIPAPLELSYKRGAIDFSSQMALCKQNKITHILLHGNVREPGFMMKEAQRLQYKAVFIGNPAAGDDNTIKLGGDAVDYSNGFYHIHNFKFVPEKGGTANAILFRESVKKYGIGAIDNRTNQWGFSAASLLCEALKRSGRNLTREGFIKAAETFKEFDNGMHNPLTYAPDRRDGGRAGNFFKAQKGTWVSISDWVTE